LLGGIGRHSRVAVGHQSADSSACAPLRHRYAVVDTVRCSDCGAAPADVAPARAKRNVSRPTNTQRVKIPVERSGATGAPESKIRQVRIAHGRGFEAMFFVQDQNMHGDLLTPSVAK
jgi:hypothetical protein